MKCEYGCNGDAFFQLKNGRWCCSKSYNSCIGMREKVANGLRNAHASGKYENANHVSWNKGLSSESDDRVKKNSESLKKLYADGTYKVWCAGSTKETNEKVKKYSEKIRDTINKKIKEGTWHVSFAKRRVHEYRGMKFNGTWELKYAMWLDSNNIKWRQPKESFVYEFEGSDHRYTPDFYLEDEQSYAEVKGYETPKDRAKWSQFPFKLKVLKGKELKELGLIDSYKDVSK